jgi:hypothetical protein
MPDPIIPDVPAALTDEPQAAAMAPADEEQGVRKTTHEIDTDDMFSSTD